MELGAGTGKFTERLVALGHEVQATDPDPAMLALLAERVPEARRTIAAADALPVPDASVDVVVAAQCYHWFDPATALPEIARVLVPGGHLGLVWNLRDERIPWVRRLGKVMGATAETTDGVESLMASDLFGETAEAVFSLWHEVNRESIVDLVRSRSYVATQPVDEQQRLIEAVLAFYDEYGRGMDGMKLPYRTHCYRAPVRKQVADSDDGPATDGGDSDTLLIDFR